VKPFAFPVTILLVALALLVPRTGWAQPDEPPPPDPAGDEARARELFRQGSSYYEQAQYDEAIGRFEEAYRLSGRPALLFNIAQAFRQKGPAFCGTALRYYEKNLQQEPDASNHAEIEELMTEMRRCTGATPAPAPPPAVAPVVTAPAPLPTPSSRWPAFTAQAGVGLGLLGVVGSIASRIKYDAVKDSCPCQPGAFERWERLSTASGVLMIAGAGALATGLLARHWLGRPSRDGVALALEPLPGGTFASTGAQLTLTVIR
jgi:hypothetical protein